MKYTVLLKKRAISALLAGAIIGAAAGMAHAEDEPGARNGAGEKPVPAGWNKAEGKRGGWLSGIFGGSAEKPAPDQAGSAPGWSSPRDGTGSCRHSSDGEEDFMCKLARIFWGPDRPQGPNRDMDDNVAAGGAGG